MVLVLVLVVPLIVSILVSIDVLHYVDVDNVWSGFWGSYLGGIISGLATLYVMTKTIHNSDEAFNKKLLAENEKEERNRAINELYSLAMDYKQLIALINKDTLIKSEYFYEWYAELKQPDIEKEDFQEDIAMLWEEIAVESELISQIVENYKFSKEDKEAFDKDLQEYCAADLSRLVRFSSNEVEEGVRKNIESDAEILKVNINIQINNIINLIKNNSKK